MSSQEHFVKYLDNLISIEVFNISFAASSDLTNIQWAINHYRSNTCIRFVPRTTESNFVTIKNNAAGCWSYMGRSTSNTYNQINLQTPGCTSTGTIVHEMMHAIGFHHEQVRPDRDQYITINRTALLPQYQTDSFFNTNFGTYSQGLVYGFTYDYGSVMHYSKWGGAASWTYPVMNNKVGEKNQNGICLTGYFF